MTYNSGERFRVEYPPMIWDEELQNWRVHLENAEAAGWRYDEERNQWFRDFRTQHSAVCHDEAPSP